MHSPALQTLLDVLIVGAGPTGLACGIEATRASLDSLVVEKGCLVNSIYSYPANMTFFTSRELLEIGDLPLPSVNVKPTRSEALEYYRRVAGHYRLPIQYEERVINVSHIPAAKAASPEARPDSVPGDEPRPLGAGSRAYFTVETQSLSGARRVYATRTVVVATGYYDLPNQLNIPGENLPKVSHYAIEGHAYYQRKVAIIGGANSAAVTGLDLYRHGAEVTIICREAELSRHIKYWIRPDLENRIKEGSITALFRSQVKEITEKSIIVATPNGEIQIENDFVFALTGYHPDVDLLERAGVKIDRESLRPELGNPASLESNVPGLYLAGVMIAGMQTNEIFIENGRFHGKQIVSDIVQKFGRAP
jgi:thioredoxin reductase (NADPH)